LQRVLSTVILLGLLLASAAAFAITEHLKLIKSPIYKTDVTTVFSPVCGCATDRAKIIFSLRSPDTITVTIVDSSGKAVATLATDRSVPKGKVTFYWDGRTDDGTVVPDASAYQPQVEFPRRTIRMPNRILVDTSAPTVVSATDGDGLLIPGDHALKIDYVLSGKARAAGYVDGRRVFLSRSKQPRGQVNWNGKRLGKPLPPGRYVLEVGAVDVAGNETPAAERKRVVVHIEDIALGETTIHARAGARFTVDVRTGATQYTWVFAGNRDSAEAPRLRLRAPSHRGRYRLVVTAQGHSTRATVIVGAP
jgi:hypothetical protein